MQILVEDLLPLCYIGPMLVRLLVLLGAAVLCAALLLLRFDHVLPAPLAERLGLRADISAIRVAQRAALRSPLAAQGLAWGSPIFLRVFKEEAELELWLAQGETFILFRTYPICNSSGELGPKLREGDLQSPEGVYRVGKAALNPSSRFHLSFNLGFPNAYDRAHDRSGSFLMVHGDCLSIGCYAMTDAGIEEIYVLAEAALDAGQERFAVHAFPFRMTEARMAAAAGHKWHRFWQELRPIYAAFEQRRIVPDVEVQGGAYHLVR